MLKLLMIVFSVILFTGCSTKELQKEVVYVDKVCPKPTIDMNEFTEAEKVGIKVHKGQFVVTIQNEDYVKMKQTNQDIKDKYEKLRTWVNTNIKNELIKNEVDSLVPK